LFLDPFRFDRFLPPDRKNKRSWKGVCHKRL